MAVPSSVLLTENFSFRLVSTMQGIWSISALVRPFRLPISRIRRVPSFQDIHPGAELGSFSVQLNRAATIDSATSRSSSAVQPSSSRRFETSTGLVRKTAGITPPVHFLDLICGRKTEHSQACPLNRKLFCVYYTNCVISGDYDGHGLRNHFV